MNPHALWVHHWYRIGGFDNQTMMPLNGMLSTSQPEPLHQPAQFHPTKLLQPKWPLCAGRCNAKWVEAQETWKSWKGLEMLKPNRFNFMEVHADIYRAYKYFQIDIYIDIIYVERCLYISLYIFQLKYILYICKNIYIYWCFVVGAKQ